MKLLVPTLAAVLLAAPFAHAKLPPLSPEAQAKADEAKAKAAWNDKVAAYQLCRAMDRVAEAYRKSPAAAGAAVAGASAASASPASASTASAATPSAAAASASASGAATTSAAARAPVPTPPCSDPGPFIAAAPAASKPIEAAGAHSPPSTAGTPPSVSPATQTQLQGAKK